jgi:WD40 repeat protein
MKKESPTTWWFPTTGQLQRSVLWDGNSESLSAVALSSDGKRALVGGRGNITAQLWSQENGERLQSNLPHRDQVRALAFSPNAKLVATACFDGMSRLWSAETGRAVGLPLARIIHV